MITSQNKKTSQKTLLNEFEFSGVGLHSGIYSSVKVLPDNSNKGITFIRSDIDKNNEIKAIWSNVSETILSTTISNSNNVSVSTIEHLMSALSGTHIDNAKIFIDGPEVPIMDGSSIPFVELIENAGFKHQKNDRKVIEVIKEIKVEKDESFAKIKPYNQFSVNFEIEFDSKLINKQSCQLQLINGNYKSDISSARTFGFEKEVNKLRANGFALGGSLDNAVVVGENNILNKGGLRFKDEFVRHKILDSIGDLYLAGFPIKGYFIGKKSGHHLNNLLLKKLFSDKTNYKII